MSVVLDSSGIDYHVVLAQNAIHHCLEVVELQPELLSALIKQTSRHTMPSKHGLPVRNGGHFKHPKSFLSQASNLFSSDCSPRHSGLGSGSSHVSQSDSKANPPNTVFIQGWMLMAIAVSVFQPKSSKLLWLLRTHFSRNKDST